MIVTLTGANDFVRRHQQDKLVADFLREHDAMALERLDGEEATAERMSEALHSLPFLTVRKLVLLREPGKQKIFAENIVEILQDIPETTDVIIVEPKLDKRLSYYKTLKKQTDFRAFEELDAPTLSSWLMTYVKEQGGVLGSAEARLLIDRLGPQQQMLAQEVNKLIAYDATISRQTIVLLTDPLPQSTVFELLDAAFQGKTSRAMELYREQRALKIEPQAIIAMLAWQLHVLAVIKAADTRSVDEIAKQAKLNPFVVRKSVEIARKVSLGQLRDNIDILLDLDVKTKSVSVDADEALQLYLLSLAR